MHENSAKPKKSLTYRYIMEIDKHYFKLLRVVGVAFIFYKIVAAMD